MNELLHVLSHGIVAVLLGCAIVTYLALRLSMWWSSRNGSSRHDNRIPWVDKSANLRWEAGFK